MFVGRKPDLSIYGLWTVCQWPGQEELPETNPEVLAFLQPKTPTLRSVPDFTNLFGPVQGGAALIQNVGTLWQWPGTAATASTKQFRFDLGYPSVEFARWVLVWKPVVGCKMRLVYFDEGGSVVEFASISPNVTGGPVGQAADITDALNALIAGRVKKHIGFQAMDDGVNPWALYESRLELNFSR